MTANFPAPLPTQRPPQPGAEFLRQSPYQLMPAPTRATRPAPLSVAAVLAWLAAAGAILFGLVFALAWPAIVASDPELAADPVMAEIPDWAMQIVGVLMIGWALIVVLGSILAWCGKLAGAILLTVQFGGFALACAASFADQTLAAGDHVSTVIVIAACVTICALPFSWGAREFYRARR